MLVGTLRRGSGMTGSGGVAEVVPVVGIERFCRSDALNCVLLRLLGAGFGTGTVCAVESVAAPATETATIKSNAGIARPYLKTTYMLEPSPSQHLEPEPR